LPTRRIFELTIVTAVLVRPAFGVVKLWARKTLGTQQSGTVTHGIAEIVVNVL
jgi:hypothetical protein